MPLSNAGQVLRPQHRVGERPREEHRQAAGDIKVERASNGVWWISGAPVIFRIYWDLVRDNYTVLKIRMMEIM